MDVKNNEPRTLIGAIRGLEEVVRRVQDLGIMTDRTLKCMKGLDMDDLIATTGTVVLGQSMIDRLYDLTDKINRERTSVAESLIVIGEMVGHPSNNE